MLEGVRFSIPSTSRIRCSRVSPALLLAPFIVSKSHTRPVLLAIAPPDGPLSTHQAVCTGPCFLTNALIAYFLPSQGQHFAMSSVVAVFSRFPIVFFLSSFSWCLAVAKAEESLPPHRYHAPPLSRSTGLNLVQVETALHPAPPPPAASVPPSSAEASPAAIRPVTASRR